MDKIFKYIVAKYFFAEYAPSVKNFKHKLRGIDGNGKAKIEFSPEDKAAIKAGIKKLTEDLRKAQF